MHMARGGWLGQTFALAKYDDSFEGKKSGIRRSKEERKGMVETFIKRYQKANNGDFPSLNLTRKEVGGSFYTVREIVREIIQENRVLGPPKSPPGDQSMDNLDSFLEHSPLGSISVDLHAHSVPPSDTQTLPEYEILSEKALNTMGTNGLHQGNLDNDNVIEEAKYPGYAELLVEREAENHTSGEERIYFETSHLSGGDVVETTHATVSNGALETQKKSDLSIQGGTGEQKDKIKEVVTKETQKHKNLEDIPVASTVHSTDEKSSEREVLDGDSEEKNTDNRELETGNNRHLDVNGSTNAETEDNYPAEEKTVNGANSQILHSKSSFNSVQHPTFDERSANLKKCSDHPSGSSQNRRINATLNRINLDSWKAASQKSYGRETHQLVKFIKSFITAFVKFWTE